MGTLTIKQQLTQLIQLGVSFEVNNGKLLVRGNLGALDEQAKAFLKNNKEDIIALIEKETGEAPEIKPVAKDKPVLLSYSQKSLWMLDRINNGSAHYNLTSAFRLKGQVDYSALNRAFLAILERHESLRSVFFVNEQGEPVQQVQPVHGFSVAYEELDSSINNINAIIAARIEEESNRIFDLTKDILLSVKLLNISSEEHILVVTMHHIASDGWSMAILVKEFNKLYSSFHKGETGALPDLNIQYADYAHWQRHWLKGKVLEEQLGFWRKQLSGLPVLHGLPLDFPRPVLQTFKGSVYTSHVSKATLNALYQLCKTESATLFMGVHAAFSSLLARYSNEKDIVVGTPVANRQRAELANLVGFFMNLLVLRCDLSGEPGFRALLRQSKKMLEEAYEYQQVPFEKIVEELVVNRNLGHSPLFQVLLALHNNTQEEMELANLVLEPVTDLEKNSARYDLSLNITETADGLVLAWEYNTSLFEETTIARMAGHFNTLLEELLAHPDENIFRVNLVGEKEAKELLPRLRGNELSLNESENAISSFYRHVTSEPGSTAVICNNIHYTYRQLGERVDAIAGLLSDAGVGIGDKVGISLLRNTDLVAAIFACFKVGATYIPLDPVYTSARIQQIVQAVQPRCIITLGAVKELCLKELHRSTFICIDKTSRAHSHEAVTAYGNGETAYIIFTSGTTGKPKGIEVTHANLNNLLKAMDVSFGTPEQQRWLAQTSVNFDISVLELIWTISRGHAIVMQQSNPFKLLPHDKIMPAKQLDFSIMFFGADKNNNHKYDLLLETAKYADQHQFTAIWTPERHFGEFGGAFPSPSVLSGALAALTKNISIRSGSVVLPLHDPIRVAEEWSVVDNLSNGRVGLSVATGWHPNDFVLGNASYTERHREMREKVAELKKIWTGIPVTRKNGVGKDFDVTIRPKPVQKELPVWVTAAGNPETFRYAGEIGANILTHMLGQTLEKLAGNIAVYHQALKENGFSIEDRKVTLMLHTYIDGSFEKALGVSEQPFKDYLGSSMKLIEPLAQELGLDINTQANELIDIAYTRFGKENTLIGTPESCQKMLLNIQHIGVTEVACLVDFGVEHEQVLKGLEYIVAAKNLYQAQAELIAHLNIEDQQTELELVHQHQVTHVQMTPSQAKLVTDVGSDDKTGKLSSVQHWFLGGEPLSRQLIASLEALTPARLYNMYGPTETTVWSAWRQVNASDFNIGQPVLNTQLLLLNECEQEVPVGVVGELYIGGAGVAKGYYNDAELTAKSFKEIDHPYFGRTRFYKTGDMMRLTHNGTFEYIGRKDNQVKLNGYRIELEEIEHAIAKIPGVKNCKVLPVTENENTYLSAYIVKENIIHGAYTQLPEAEQARPFHFADGSIIYHQSSRQLATLYEEIFEDEIYFKHDITLPENGLVFDAGANIGGFSIDVSQRYPGASIIAFEPVPQIFSALQKNFEHRQIRGRILNYGVSNKKETATFHYYPEMSGMSGRFTEKDTIINAVGRYMEYEKSQMVGNTKYETSEDEKVIKSFYDNVNGENDLSNDFKSYLTTLYDTVEVECRLTTISDVIDELNVPFIDLLKIDVEKSECLVLEGIREEHWPKIHQLVVEVDGDNHLEIIKDLLHKKGYQVIVDELVMSDAEMPSNDNTYILYAKQAQYRRPEAHHATQLMAPPVYETPVRDYLKQVLPDYMVPRAISFVPAIPLMENGKVDMVKLKQVKHQEPETSPNTTRLSNQVEMDIYRIWCEVLKKESIPYHVSLFEAGGNSIEVILLHDKIQKHFNTSFPLIELFRNPTIAQQAKLIQQSGSTGGGEEMKKAINKGAARRNARAGKTN